TRRFAFWEVVREAVSILPSIRKTACWVPSTNSCCRSDTDKIPSIGGGSTSNSLRRSDASAIFLVFAMGFRRGDLSGSLYNRSRTPTAAFWPAHQLHSAACAGQSAVRRDDFDPVGLQKARGSACIQASFPGRVASRHSEAGRNHPHQSCCGPLLQRPGITASSVGIGVYYYRHADQVRQAPRLQLLDNVSAMQLDGAKADAEMAGDDLVRLARRDQLEYVAFAGCQQGRAGLQRGAFETLFIRPVVPMQRSLDIFEQGVLAQWLLDEIEGPGLHRCNRQRNRAMARYKYNRDTPAADIESLLQFEPAYLGHLYIEQQAAASPRIVIFEKRARRWKRFHRISGRAQHKSQPLPHGGIIVDDEDGLIRHRCLLPHRLSAGRRRRSRRKGRCAPFGDCRHATRR